MAAQCDGCNKCFKSNRGLHIHWNASKSCVDSIVFHRNKENQIFNCNTKGDSTNSFCQYNENFSITDSDYVLLTNGGVDEEFIEPVEEYIEAENYDNSLCEMNDRHIYSEKKELMANATMFKSGVDLLNILNNANSPNYMFDEIMEWARKSSMEYKVEFNDKNIISREKTINNYIEQYDLMGIQRKLKTVTLPGCKMKVELVYHDFKQCLYSLLNDNSLMVEENLLLNPDDIFEIPSRIMKVGDINTGTAYRHAYNLYAKGKKNIILCPIIFFIDKTFTDNNGRLNLEQIRFTLGIFKREVRNRPQAWRTLGYITDQARLKTDITSQKCGDYHFMTDIILESFKEAQKDAIGWKLQLNNCTKLVYFRCPVLFIIGDTDGHDKMCGKYTNRTHANRLCRCCNIPKDETDNVRFNFRYTKQNEIKRLFQYEREEEMNDLSYYCIKNAWHDVLFCDPLRGINGACPGEIMHCLQHGLYLYCIKGLFSQKAVKKVSGKKRKNNENDGIVPVQFQEYSLEDEILMNPTQELSSFSVFTDTYCKRFDFVTRQYGKLLQ